jgi:hypothetical protein
MSFAAAAGIGGALLGGLAGAQGQSSRTSRILPTASAFENQLNKDVEGQWKSFQELLNAGPGQEYMGQSVEAQNDLASLLKQFANGGFMPGQQDISQANSLAQSLFAPQQTAMQQAFQDQQVMGQRAAAKLGRGAADPVLMNKLAQEQTRQQQMLQSQMGSYATQYAQQMPQMRLGYQQDFTNVKMGLASQAMANRQALLSMGNNMLGNERNFRLGASSQETKSGGGLAGMISGALGGLGTGLGAANMMSGFSMPSFGGGGAGGATPVAANVSKGPNVMHNGI